MRKALTGGWERRRQLKAVGKVNVAGLPAKAGSHLKPPRIGHHLSAAISPAADRFENGRDFEKTTGLRAKAQVG